MDTTSSTDDLSTPEERQSLETIENMIEKQLKESHVDSHYDTKTEEQSKDTNDDLPPLEERQYLAEQNPTTLKTVEKDVEDSHVDSHPYSRPDEESKASICILLDNISKLDVYESDKQILADIATNTAGERVIELGNIGDAGAGSLAEGLCNNTTLQALCCSEDDIGRIGAAALAYGLSNNKTLQSLTLCGNTIVSAGADALVNGLCNMTLQFLILMGSNIGDVGAAALSEILCNNTTLQILALWGIGLGDISAAALAYGLCNNTTLQTLNLGYNKIGPAGAAALADGICKNTTLQSLLLFHNEIGPTGAAAFAQRLGGRANLQELLDTNSIGSIGAAPLAAALSNNTTHEDFVLQRNDIEGLCNETTLQTLDFWLNKIGFIGATLADGLCNNTTLQELDLGCNKIGPTGAAELAGVLCNNTTLRSLYLVANSIGPTGAATIAQRLDNRACLRALFLGSNNIGDMGAAALAERLGNNATLQTLHLSSNNIGPAGAAALADGLCNNTNLQSLCLGFKADDTARFEVDYLAHGIDSDDSALYDKNNIGDMGATVLAEGLDKNTTLQTLHVGYNNIEDMGAAALAERLRNNKVLQNLNLDGNNISHAGILGLAKIFRLNDNLQSISVCPTSIKSFSIKTKREIGRGEFGSVELVERIDDSGDEAGEAVAKTSHDNGNREGVYEELVLHGLPLHENVVSLAGASSDGILLLQLHNGGSLREYAMKMKGCVPLPQFISYSHGMSEAINHLHINGLVHRDTALRNYVLSADLKRTVLVDFGLSWPIEEEKAVEIRSTEKMPFRQCAPEVLATLQYSKAADIWQLGLSFWQMIHSGKQPFFFIHNSYKLAQYIHKKMVKENAPLALKFKKQGSPVLINTVKEVVSLCCSYDPAKRLTAAQVVQKIQSLRRPTVIAQPEEEKGPKYEPDEEAVNDGLNAYKFTDYQLLETGGHSKYIDLKDGHEYELLGDDEYERLGKLADIYLEEEGGDVENVHV